MFRSLAYVLVCLVGLVSNVAAETIDVGIGLSKPPYVIQQNNTGAEYEIVERALQIAGYKMKPRYMPMLRIPHEINGGSLGAGMTMRAHMAVDGFFSDIVMVYHNYAISLKNENIKVSSLEDLNDLSVVAFHNAHKLLGEAFSKMATKNKHYTEIPRQALQIKMLAAKRVQVVVADFRIFLHFKKQYEKEAGMKVAATFHKIFPPTPYRVVFKSRMVRDAFDDALRKMRETGEYDRIMEKYITKDDLKELAITG